MAPKALLLKHQAYGKHLAQMRICVSAVDSSPGREIRPIKHHRGGLCYGWICTSAARFAKSK